MKYVLARLKEENRRYSYEYYITDCLMSLARANIRFADLVSEVPVDNRTETEIVESIKAKMKGGDQGGRGI